MQTKVNPWDSSTRKVLGFLVAKGFLLAPGVKPKPTVKIDVGEALKVATEQEPRVLEVLPAAMLRFPKTFLHWEKLPEKFEAVLECLRKNLDEGPDLGGIPYKTIKSWPHYDLPDGRTVPNCEKKVKKYWKLRPAVVEEIQRRAQERGVSESALLEELLEM